MPRKTGIAIFVIVDLAVVLGLIYWFVLRPPGSEDELTEASVREMVPEASSLSADDARVVFRSSPAPSLKTLPTHPLTLVHLALMSGSIPRVTTPEGLQELRDAEGTPPKPQDFADELQRGSFFSTVNEDRITGCTCEVQGEEATGVVTFDVPEMYSGQVHYRALREDGTWRIREFSLPAHGVKTVLDDEGFWSATVGP